MRDGCAIMEIVARNVNPLHCCLQMSPEQAAADRHLDPRSDIYSLGCVVYEMLAGETPFTGRTAQALIARRLADPVPDLCTVRDAPRQVERVVRQALARSPADRFANAPTIARAFGGRGKRIRRDREPRRSTRSAGRGGGAPGRARRRRRLAARSPPLLAFPTRFLHLIDRYRTRHQRGWGHGYTIMAG